MGQNGGDGESSPGGDGLLVYPEGDPTETHEGDGGQEHGHYVDVELPLELYVHTQLSVHYA